MARITLDHLVRRLETSVRYLRHAQLLVVRLLGRDDGRVGDEREVDPRVRDQVGLELGQVDVEGAVKAERGSDGRDNLSNEPVQVGVRGALDVEVAAADVVDRLVVDHEGAVRVLERRVRCQDRVVRLDNGSGDLKDENTRGRGRHNE